MADTDRARDDRGRARNSRPRDELGRPLAYGSTDQAIQVSETALPPAQALVYAQELLDAGRPFSAHEVLEASWKAAPESERDVWQGLAQLAVGVTHAARGNPTGARRLLERAEDNLGSAEASAPHQIDIAGLRGWAQQQVARLQVARVGESLSLKIPRLTVVDREAHR